MVVKVNEHCRLTETQLIPNTLDRCFGFRDRTEKSDNSPPNWQDIYAATVPRLARTHTHTHTHIALKRDAFLQPVYFMHFRTTSRRGTTQRLIH